MTVEGAYINQSIGGGSPSSFAIDQPNVVPWLVAAACLTIVGTVLLTMRQNS